MIDVSLLQDFIAETGEHLQEMESNLLLLEADPGNREVLNDIFRSAHTIKGSSEYLGLEKIAELSHKLENLLEILRKPDKAQAPDREMVDILMMARDRISVLTQELEQFQQEKSDVRDLIARIDMTVSGKKQGASEKQAMPPAKSDTEDTLVLGDSVSDILKEEPSETDDADDDVYEEDYDDELFEIFIQHLKENLSSIRHLIQELQEGEPVAAILLKALELIRSLSSSANYMDYKGLTLLYQKWIARIESFQSKVPPDISAAHPFRIEIISFMEEFAGKVIGRFPKFKEQFDAHIASAKSSEPEEDILSIDISDIEDDDDKDDEDSLELEPSALGDEPSVIGLSDPEPEEPIIQSMAQVLPETDDEGEVLEIPEEAVLEKPEISALSEPEEPETVPSVKAAKSADYSGLFDELEGAFGSADIEEEIEDSQEDIEQALSLSKPDIRAELPSEAEPIRIEETAISQATKSRHEDEAPVMPVAEQITEPAELSAPEGPEMKFTPHPERLARQSLRVDTAKIDSLMNQVGELVVSRAWFSQLFNEMRELQEHLHRTAKLDQRQMKPVKALTFRLSEATLALGRVANELQEGVMKVRMLPIAQLFNRYPRLVRDLIHGTDKRVNLDIVGEETELDKMVIEEISDPLIHIIRNAVDHGCESAEERRRDGKPEECRIRLESYHESNHVVIEISDDGRGIDPAVVKAKAIEKGFYSAEELERMSSKEIVNIIMKPGFSTANEVSKTSGRGVGMDVVKKNVEKLNGTIEIDSAPKAGTRFRIKIPLTLAIIQALLVRVGHDIFTIPLAAVEETLRIFEHNITTIEGTEVIHLRDSTLPLLRLSEIFNIEDETRNTSKSFVVVVNTGMRRAGLVVDALIGQEEAVIKPLVDYLQESSGFSGATIMGDGRISLILDVYELINMSIGRQIRQNKMPMAQSA